MEMPDDIEVYKVGLFCCSVCAPLDMSAEEVVRRTNEQEPSGTSDGWMLSEEKTFKDGKTKNGGEVHCYRGDTRHWLLEV